MAESLIIQMRDGVAPQWMVCNDDGHVAVNAMSGELAQALPLAVGRRVAVIVPGTEVLTTEAEAPAKNAAKLAQVIPYALEERVADEIEDLHFAIGERNAANAMRSRVAYRSWSWRARASTHGWPRCAPPGSAHRLSTPRLRCCPPCRASS
jgi:type II secretion system protein L